MNVLNRIDKANTNIEILIENYISEVESNNSNYCPRNETVIKNCIHNCEKCKQDYYENLFIEMKKKYTV
jgi:hypothetical protein